MTRRFPWLNGRKRFIGVAIAEAISISCCYIYGYWYTDSVSIKGTTVAAVMLTWCSVSYLIGRYSVSRVREERGDASFWTDFWPLVGACIGFGVLVGLNTWLFQVSGAVTRYPAFIGSIVGIQLLACCAIQGLRRLWVKQGMRWILVCSKSEREYVYRSIQSKRCIDTNKVEFQSVDKLDRVFHEVGTNSSDGFAISSSCKLDNRFIIESSVIRNSGSRVVPLVTWYEELFQKIPSKIVSTEWLVFNIWSRAGTETFYTRLKRVIDVVGALLILIVTAPIVLLAVMSVFVEDGRPFFYRQKRTGIGGKCIQITKIRTMIISAERDGARWSGARDTRITRVGRLLRALRIDEIPQLLMVLSGEMSLIGPRPERPEMEELIISEFPHFSLRYVIKPGLSGWAQVCYPYGSDVRDAGEKLDYDLFYIRHASLPLDILIILKTIRLLFTGSSILQSSRK